MRRFLLSTAVASLLSPALGALYTDPSQLKKTTYDYIIVGAGTAGNVVADRLSADYSKSVLVIEAGVADDDVAVSVPILGPSLEPHTIYDWNYTTTPQAAYNGRTIPYSRGRVLGGSSSVNYMVYTRGSTEDYDRYAALSGDPGWGWNSIEKFIPRHESFVPPADGHNTDGQYDPAVHGTNGTLYVSLYGDATPIDSKVIATTQELSSEFPFIVDMNNGSTLGIGYTQGTIGYGKRSSSSSSYLAEAMKRSNIDVLINSQVTKVIQTGQVNGLPSFHTVQFATGKGATLYTAKATKEIILSAGTIGTPTILQLSGIGNKADLTALGIPVIVNNPSVGQNLSDHPLLPNVWNVNSTDTLDTLFRNQTLYDAAFNEWKQSKTGPFANTVTNNIGFFRLPSNSSIFQTVTDPSPGPASPHYELIFSNLWVVPGVPAPSTGNFLSITTVLITPTSRGSTKLSSSDPFDKPIINPNLANSDFDIFTLREATRAAIRFMAATPWKGYALAPYGDLANATTDAQIDDHIRNNAATIFHPCGTASMSPKGASWGVVDPDLKVKGVEGLRVVDASIFPIVTGGHPQAPIYLMAERAATLIN